LFGHRFGVSWHWDTETAFQRYASAAAVTGKSAVGVGGGRNGKMFHVPSPNPTVSRRRVLISTAALALLGIPAVACGSSEPPPEVDELAAQLERARTDSQLATDAAAAARGAIAEALNTVSSERAAHAQALTDELVRMRGTDAPTTTTPTSTTAAPSATPTVKDVIAALTQSAASATELATKMSGYRAGLLGSIAAACTAAYTVALVPPGSAP
jgi:hypothetical protein